MAKKKKIADFETATERLEEIVEIIDCGELPLHETVNLYKEGVELATFCAEGLQKAEQEVMELRKTADAAFELVMFDDEL